jgi:hypothetical protein
MIAIGDTTFLYGRGDKNTPGRWWRARGAIFQRLWNVGTKWISKAQIISKDFTISNVLLPTRKG